MVFPWKVVAGSLWTFTCSRWHLLGWDTLAGVQFQMRNSLQKNPGWKFSMNEAGNVTERYRSIRSRSGMGFWRIFLRLSKYQDRLVVFPNRTGFITQMVVLMKCQQLHRARFGRLRFSLHATGTVPPNPKHVVYVWIWCLLNMRLLLVTVESHANYDKFWNGTVFPWSEKTFFVSHSSTDRKSPFSWCWIWNCLTRCPRLVRHERRRMSKSKGTSFTLKC